jgi:formamidopyrimidine-DNA glycosylase
MEPAMFSRKLKGAVLKASQRHGKYLLLEASGSQYLILHFGMTGYPKYLRIKDRIPAHTRMLLDFGHSRMALVDTRRLGMIYLYDNVNDFLRDKRLGPDALGIDMDAFLEKLSGRNKPVKSALMDQSIFAGVGNLYSDEILFQACIHPLSICSSIDSASLELLYRSMKQVLNAAVGAEADMDKYPRDWLLTNREKGAACPNCGGGLDIVRIGGRTAYFCPKTQKRFI